MAKSKVVVPKMGAFDYRSPNSFIHFYGNLWSDFLKRWEDKNISTDEAKGLLDGVADRLNGWAYPYPENLGEDNRETCVRFLLHYATHPYRHDDEWQIVEKARKVIIGKALLSGYINDMASDELVQDILAYFDNNKKELLNLDVLERKKFEEFLRRATRRKNDTIRLHRGKFLDYLFENSVSSISEL